MTDSAVRTGLTIAVGADHAGFRLKDRLAAHLADRGITILDLGTNDGDRVDYPDYGTAVGRAVASGEADLGVAVCGSGLGIAMAANKVPGVRAAPVHDVTSARLTRQHNDANVLCLGAKIIGGMIAMEIVKTFMATPPLTAEKYVRRVKKVQKINDEHCVPVK